MRKLNKNMAVISALSDLPNATDGLSPASFKEKFDENGINIKKYINDELIPDIETLAGTKENSADITTKRKLDPNGNFTGSWFGLKNPVASEPGIQNMVNELVKKDVFKKDTFGTFESAASLSVQANEANVRPQILGVENVSDLTKYTDRDSVGLYVANRGVTPTIDHSGGVIVYNSDRVTISNIVLNLDKIKVGMIIETKHTPNKFVSVVKEIDKVNQVIIIQDGWYEIKSGGSALPSTPSNDVGFVINPISKIWAINNNVYLRPEGDVMRAVAQESGLFATKEGAVANGIDVVNFGNKAEFGYWVRRNDPNNITDVSFEHAYLAQSAENAFTNFSSIPTRVLLAAFVNGNKDVDGFEVRNDGRMSKLKLNLLVASNGVTQFTNNTQKIFITNKTINEALLLPSATGKTGELLFVMNVSSIPQTLGTVDTSKFVVNDSASVDTLTLNSRANAIFVSNGTHWYSLLGSFTTGGGYFRENGGLIRGNVDISNPSGTTILELGNKTIASSAVIDLNSSGNNNDYDARFIVTGGTSANGKGNVNLDAETFKVKNRDVATVRVGGAPQSNPEFIGQLYVDSTSKIGYIGVSATEWKQITV